MFGATRRREATDTHLLSGGVDPQEVLEERGLVPVEELREEVVERTAPSARQREDPSGEAADAPAEVRSPVSSGAISSHPLPSPNRRS